MAKVYTKIGFGANVTSAPGVTIDAIVKEQGYYGDVIRDTRSISNSERIVDDVHISNRISIVADPFAFENFHNMRYATFMGTKWRINDAELQYPRIVLSLGGVYNGPTFNAS